MNPFDAPQAQNVVSIVYYVTFDDGETVKIGATTSPRMRFQSLAREFGSSLKLLAAEPGHFQAEKAVQRAFDDQRVRMRSGQGGTEFFRMNARLRDHIKLVRKRNPNWRNLPDQVDKRRGPRPASRRRSGVGPASASTRPYPSTTSCLAALPDTAPG